MMNLVDAAFVVVFVTVLLGISVFAVLVDSVTTKDLEERRRARKAEEENDEDD